MARLFGLGEVVRMTGVLSHRINYALESGYLEEPKFWVSNKRAWTEEELQKLASYFGTEINWDGVHKAKTEL